MGNRVAAGLRPRSTARQMESNTGAGKSVLATRLARDLVAAQRATGRVPFKVAASTWDPGKDMADWIADQLTHTPLQLHLKVRARPGRRTRLADELAENRVIPIIDGLDELPHEVRAKAIEK